MIKKKLTSAVVVPVDDAATPRPPPPAGSAGVAAMAMGATTHGPAQLFRHILATYFCMETTVFVLLPKFWGQTTYSWKHRFGRCWHAVSEVRCTSRKKVPVGVWLNLTRPSCVRFCSMPNPPQAGGGESTTTGALSAVTAAYQPSILPRPYVRTW